MYCMYVCVCTHVPHVCTIFFLLFFFPLGLSFHFLLFCFGLGEEEEEEEDEEEEEEEEEEVASFKARVHSMEDGKRKLTIPCGV